MAKIDPNSNIVYEKAISECIISMFEKSDAGFTREEIQKQICTLPEVTLLSTKTVFETTSTFMDIMGKAGMIICEDDRYYKAIYGKKVGNNNKNIKNKKGE